jgi:hypothetical protein
MESRLLESRAGLPLVLGTHASIHHVVNLEDIEEGALQEAGHWLVGVSLLMAELYTGLCQVHVRNEAASDVHFHGSR